MYIFDASLIPFNIYMAMNRKCMILVQNLRTMFCLWYKSNDIAIVQTEEYKFNIRQLLKH